MRNNYTDTYIFINEYDTTSTGAASVIINLTLGLIDLGQKVVVFNNKNGKIKNALAQESNSDNIQIFNSDNKSIKKFVSKACLSNIPKFTIVAFAINSKIYEFKKINPKLIFYPIDTYSLLNSNKLSIFHFKYLTKKLFKQLREENGILFMDSFVKKVLQDALEAKPTVGDLLPIPVVIPQQNLFLDKLNTKDTINNLNITYIGRAVDWKIHPISRILTDLETSGSKKFNYYFVHIITDDAKAFQQKIKGIANNITLVFYENLSQSSLSKLLVEKSDVHFAMGTSAIDGAKLGIPTILLDYSFFPIPDSYNYKFLFESNGYILGRDIATLNKEEVNKGINLDNMIEMLSDYRQLEKISRLTYDYVNTNHHSTKVAKKLLQYTQLSKSLLRNYSGCLIRLNPLYHALLKILRTNAK